MGAETIGGRYQLDGRLGEGGMGQVYRARHLQLGKAFALKIISPAFALDSSARARFNEEAKLASEISHPNIVSVVDFGEDPQFGAYMVMELVDGEPMIDKSGSPMAVRRACDILAQIADALDHIHRRGIVHGDVKAENIMLTRELPADATGAQRRRVARLLDFGLARRHETSSPALEEQISGSPHYLAPERAAGGVPSVAADVYALGVLGYLMLTGTLPFQGSVVEILMAHIHQPVEAMSKRRGESLDHALEAMILRSLSKDPSRRHGSAAAFRTELHSVMDLLEMSRRRHASGTIKPEQDRDNLLASAFERSRVAQALISAEGTIQFSNKAFVALLGEDHDKGVDGRRIDDTTLAQQVPGLMRAVRATHVGGKPQERRARIHRGNQPALELTVWLSPLPLPGMEVHLWVRVDEVDPRRSE